MRSRFHVKRGQLGNPLYPEFPGTVITFLLNYG